MFFRLRLDALILNKNYRRTFQDFLIKFQSFLLFSHFLLKWWHSFIDIVNSCILINFMWNNWIVWTLWKHSSVLLGVFLRYFVGSMRVGLGIGFCETKLAQLQWAQHWASFLFWVYDFFELRDFKFYYIFWLKLVEVVILFKWNVMELWSLFVMIFSVSLFHFLIFFFTRIFKFWIFNERWNYFTFILFF